MDETAKTVASWSDLGSLALLLVSLLVGGLNPSRPLWGWSTSRNVGLFAILSASITYSIFRYIYEGITETPGPREFLTINVIYLARWVYLWLRLVRRSSPEARLYKVACAFRDMKTVRIRLSSHKERRGEHEIVVRSGEAFAPSNVEQDDKYWRGRYNPKKKPKFHEKQRIHEVHLLEAGLHGQLLDSFGSIEFLNADTYKFDEAYKRMFDVVLTALGASDKYDFGGNVPKPEEQVPPDDPNHIFKYSIVNPYAIANRVGAVDDRVIGGIARRIAGDALEYVRFPDKEFRTEKQVEQLNECLDKYVERLLTGELL